MKKIMRRVKYGRVVHASIVASLFMILAYLLSIFRLLGQVEPFNPIQQFASVGGFVYGVAILLVGMYGASCLSKRLLIRFGIGYIGYLVLSYSMVITRNVNNVAFIIDDIIGNQAIETGFLLSLLLIFMIALLWRQVMKKQKRWLRWSQVMQLENTFLFSALATVAINDSKWLASVTVGLQEWYLRSNWSGWIVQFSLIQVLAFTSFGGMLALLMAAFKDLRQNRASLALSMVASLAMAIIFNYGLQFGVRADESLFGQFILNGATVFQIVFLTMMNLFFYMMFNRFVATSLGLWNTWLFITVANYLKFQMRNEPLLITDFVWLNELDLLVTFVERWMVYVAGGMVVCTIGIYLFVRKRFLVNPIVARKRTRLCIGVLLMSMTVGLLAVFRGEREQRIIDGIPVVSVLNNQIDITWVGFSANARFKSVSYVWLKQLTKSIMETPDGYSKATIAEIYKKYAHIAAEMNRDRRELLSDQTIIYILSEGFADPERLPDVELSQPVIPAIKQIKEKTTSGMMHSDGYGGGTANMEFQTLIGLPFYNFSPSVAVLYTEVLPMMERIPSISDLFAPEDRIIIHPSSANNYERQRVYTRLGFEQQFFLTDGQQDLTNVEYVGVSVSDASVYRNVLEQLDPKKEQFFSVITMQNHAPWSVGGPVEVTATGEMFTSEENEKLTEFARLLTYTDQATKEFLDQLRQINKKITVVFYGDHLPGLYPTSTFEKNEELQYRTDYFIWSNYQTQQLDHPLINSSDFIASLHAHTNAKVSPYYALLTAVMEEASVDQTTWSDAQNEIANDLRLIQYDLTIGKGYIHAYPAFFEVEQQ